MTRSAWAAASGLLLAGQLLAGCSKESLQQDPQPRTATAQNVYATGGQVDVPFVQTASSGNATTFFRYRSTEPSGGNKLYQWQYTTGQTYPASQGQPGAPTYFPSPGAIWVASQGDQPLPIIVDVQGNVEYYENGSGWATLNSGGLKFTKIAAQDLSISSYNGLTISGLLFGIAQDKRVYQFDVNSLAWVALGSILATDITVDVYGRAYVISTPPGSAVAGLYATNSSYGHTPFSSWISYTAPASASGQLISISTTYPSRAAVLAVYSETNRRGGNSYIFWKPILNSSPTQDDYQLLQDSNSQSGGGSLYTFVGSGGDLMWVATSNVNLNWLETIYQ